MEAGCVTRNWPQKLFERDQTISIQVKPILRQPSSTQNKRDTKRAMATTEWIFGNGFKDWVLQWERTFGKVGRACLCRGDGPMKPAPAQAQQNLDCWLRRRQSWKLPTWKIRQKAQMGRYWYRCGGHCPCQTCEISCGFFETSQRGAAKGE